jgi:hypothetical protein
MRLPHVANPSLLAALTFLPPGFNLNPGPNHLNPMRETVAGPATHQV